MAVAWPITSSRAGRQIAVAVAAAAEPTEADVSLFIELDTSTHYSIFSPF